MARSLQLLGALVALMFGLSACQPPAATVPNGTDTAATTAPAAEATTAANAGGGDLAPEGTLLRTIQDRGKLVCGSKSEIPNFGALNPATNQVEGFDVEVCKAVAGHILGDPEAIEVKEAILNDRIALLKDGGVDIVAGIMTINADRLKEIDFSNVYFVAQQALLVPAGSNVTSLADLKGQRIGNVRGSSSETNLTSAAEKEAIELEVSLFDTYSEAVAALDAGQLDAVTADDIILYSTVRQDPGKWKVVGGPLSVEPYGIGLPKGEPELLTAVNAALADMKASGAWMAAYHKWVAADQSPELPPDDWQAVTMPSR
jgi:putative glutamine transport system substrate-binding protein